MTILLAGRRQVQFDTQGFIVPSETSVTGTSSRSQHSGMLQRKAPVIGNPATSGSLSAAIFSEDATGQMSKSNVDNPEQPSWQYRYISAALAFFTWGGWAYFVNVRSATVHDAPPVVSALIHGTASCIVTLLMLRSVTFLYHRLSGHPLRRVLPAIITTTVTGSCFLTAHWWVGTANLPATIVPGLIVALAFNTLTACKLRAQRQAHSV